MGRVALRSDWQPRLACCRCLPRAQSKFFCNARLGTSEGQVGGTATVNSSVQYGNSSQSYPTAKSRMDKQDHRLVRRAVFQARVQIAPIVASVAKDMQIARTRRLTGLKVVIWCVSNRVETAHARRSAASMTKIPMSRKNVAMAFGIHSGSIALKRALNPKPIPIAAKEVRAQPANVRSFARMVRSSARPVLSSASSVRFSPAMSFLFRGAVKADPQPCGQPRVSTWLQAQASKTIQIAVPTVSRSRLVPEANSTTTMSSQSRLRIIMGGAVSLIATRLRSAQLSPSPASLRS